MTPLEESIVDVLTPILGAAPIRMNQNGPRPPLPYTAYMISSSRTKGMDEYSAPSDGGSQVVSGNREFTLTLQRYSTTGPVEFLQDVRDKLRLQSVMDAWIVRGMTAFDASGVEDISMKMETQIEPRATMDVFVRYRSSLTDNVGIIETAHITGTDDGKDSPTYTVTVEV